jgi:hypothetical protein
MHFNPDLTENLSLSAAERKLVDKLPDADSESRLRSLEEQISAFTLPVTDVHSQTASDIATQMLESAGLSLDLDRAEKAYEYARACVDIFIAHERFEDAALACQYVYLTEQADAVPALGQAAWLSVTYPVNPHLTANVMDLIINEMPDNSDGAAVAAATAHYVVDLRSNADEHGDLRLFTGAMLARVARRHSNIDSQQMFELWVERLELDDPAKFLGRLRNVVDVMVQDEWWFDRESLQAALPD